MSTRWKDIRKIDAHAHVVLHERVGTDLVLNRPDDFLRMMDEHRVERAVVVPINYPTYFPWSAESGGDWLRANNDVQAEIARTADGRLVAFADCAIDGAYGHPARGVAELERAIRELGLAGLKIHASNLKTSADDPRILPWIDKAADLGVPVIFHSNPSGYDPDFYGSAPSRIYRAVYGRTVTYVIAHMGGVSFFECMAGGGYVDVSGSLLTLGRMLGPPAVASLLRAIGVHRVLFATDYPIHPYEAYYEILDAMDLSDSEAEGIAHRNAKRMLNGLPPLEADDAI